MLNAVVNVLTPDVFTGAVPNVFGPSAKITEPERVALAGNFG